MILKIISWSVVTVFAAGALGMFWGLGSIVKHFYDEGAMPLALIFGGALLVAISMIVGAVVGSVTEGKQNV